MISHGEGPADYAFFCKWEFLLTIPGKRMNK